MCFTTQFSTRKNSLVPTREAAANLLRHCGLAALVWSVSCLSFQVCALPLLWHLDVYSFARSALLGAVGMEFGPGQTYEGAFHHCSNPALCFCLNGIHIPTVKEKHKSCCRKLTYRRALRTLAPSGSWREERAVRLGVCSSLTQLWGPANHLIPFWAQ